MSLTQQFGPKKMTGVYGAMATATDEGAGAAATIQDGMQESSGELLPPCTLNRDEMACLKTALAVIVMKRRFQLAQKPAGTIHKKAKSTTTSTAQQALANMMGRTVPETSAAAGGGGGAATDPLSRWASQHQPNHFPRKRCGSVETTAAALPLSSASNWASHLQHILSLVWQGLQIASEGCNSTRCQGLCIHVACQLDQVMAAQQDNETKQSDCNKLKPTANNKRSTISDWLGTQLTSFVVPSSISEVDVPSAIVALQDDWVTVWKTIIQAKPLSMSELFVPTLLELLLQPSSSKGQTTKLSCFSGTTVHGSTLSNRITDIYKPSQNDNTENRNTTLSLESAHLLLLFETALESAPAHVLQETHNALLPWESSQHGTSNSSAVALLPSANSSWYSTQDLAYDYYYLSTRSTTTTTTATAATTTQNSLANNAGQVCLLRHGLAAISEALTVAVASSSTTSTKYHKNHNASIETDG